MKKLIKNYTTDVPVEKTIAEIEKLLSENGATAIAKEYENGLTKKIFFKLIVDGKEMPFRLPAKPEKVYAALFSNMPGQYNAKWKAERLKKSEMIAWRACKLWLEAQLTHINLEQAEVIEVFLPYLITGNNKTMFESLKENQFLLPSTIT